MWANNKGETNPIRATSCSRFDDLKNLDAESLDGLDFTGFIEQFGSDKLDELFPKNPRYGQLDPAPSYLVSGRKVREWRRISGGSQKHIIDQHEEERSRERQRVVTGSRGTRQSRRERRNRRQLATDTAPPAGDEELMPSSEGSEVRPSEPDTARTERSASNDGSGGELPPKRRRIAIKATSYHQFWALKRLDAEILDVLDYADLEEKFGAGKLDELFPKDPKYGQLDPVPSYLVSGRKVREWRGMGTLDQMKAVQQYEEDNEREKQMQVEAFLESRMNDDMSHDNDEADLDIDQLDHGREDEGVRWVETLHGVYVAQRYEEEDQQEMKSLNGLSNKPQSSNQRKRQRATTAASNASSIPIAGNTGTKDRSNLPKEQNTTITPGRCRGITKQMILDLKHRDTDRIERGFRRLVGKAYSLKAEKISRTGEWNHGNDVAGFVIDNNNSNYSWKCLEVGINLWSFHLYDCDLDAALPSGASWCESCWGNRNDFFDMCREEFDKRC